MTPEELYKHFQTSTEIPDEAYWDAEKTMEIVYSLLPLYKEKITDYCTILQGKTVLALGFSYNEKHYLKRHITKYGGTFRFTKNDKENFFIVSPRTWLYNMVYALRKAREEGAIIIDYDYLVQNFDEVFNDSEEERIKAKEREEEAAKPRRDSTFRRLSNESLSVFAKTSSKELCLETDVFHVIGRIDCYIFENNKTRYFTSKQDIYNFIAERGGQYTKKESNNITCLIYGQNPSEEVMMSHRGKDKLISAESFVEWLRVHRFNVCSDEDLACIPNTPIEDISLETDVFHVVGKIHHNFWYDNDRRLKDYNSQESVYSFIAEKGGEFIKTDSPKVTCVVYGKEPVKDAMMGYLDTVKLINADSFIEWLYDQSAINKKCRAFGEKYLCSVDPTLRPYQQEKKEWIFTKWNSYFNVMLQLPTGAGKTVLFTSIIHDLNKVKETKILILAHRKELIDQISEHLTKYKIEHGIITSGRVRRLEYDVQVASIQTITHKDNEDILEKIAPKFIIIDEAHHSLAKTYTTFWKRCQDTWKLGVTATPYRLNKRSFKGYFDQLITSYNIEKFIELGFLSDYTLYIDNPNSDLSKAIDSIKERSSTGDYKTSDLLNVLNVDRHIQKLVLCYMQYANEKKGIVYAVSKEHAYNICQAYQKIGIPAEYVDSETNKTTRQDIIERFKKGKTKIMVNVNIFSEGFDCPDIDFIQLARPTWSLALYLQQVGRGMRVSANKAQTIILDNAGLFLRFGYPSSKRMWNGYFEGERALWDSDWDEERKFKRLRRLSTLSDDLMIRIPSRINLNKDNSENEQYQNIEIVSEMPAEKSGIKLLSEDREKKSDQSYQEKSEVPSNQIALVKSPSINKYEDIQQLYVKLYAEDCKKNEERIKRQKEAYKAKIEQNRLERENAKKYELELFEKKETEDEKDERKNNLKILGWIIFFVVLMVILIKTGMLIIFGLIGLAAGVASFKK